MNLVIVQARMSSTRLPGKVMREVCGKPLIGHLLDRLALSKHVGRMVVATSIDSSNNELCDYVQSKGVEVFRGDEQDVLGRYYQAALLHKPKTVIRITADCPLMDPALVDECIFYFEENEFDYVSNVFPRTYPDGMDVEVFSFETLEKTQQNAQTAEEREHVTPFMRESGLFKIGSVVSDENHSQVRITVDHEDDVFVIQSICEHLGANGQYFSMKDILDFKKSNPDCFKKNEHLVVG